MVAFVRELPRDVADVLETASLLDVSEYRVFELAHRAWFGAAAGDRAGLDRRFFAYLYRDEVPPWVRRFARAVVASGRKAGFDPAMWGAPRPPPPRRATIRLGVRHAFCTLAAVAAVFATAHCAAEPFGCLFPPCY